MQINELIDDFLKNDHICGKTKINVVLAKYSNSFHVGSVNFYSKYFFLEGLKIVLSNENHLFIIDRNIRFAQSYCCVKVTEFMIIT